MAPGGRAGVDGLQDLAPPLQADAAQHRLAHRLGDARDLVVEGDQREQRLAAADRREQGGKIAVVVGRTRERADGRERGGHSGPAPKSESALDGLATGRECGPPRMRRPRGGAGRRPAAVSDKESERFRVKRKRSRPAFARRRRCPIHGSAGGMRGSMATVHVIGAGMAGISCAVELVKARQRVVLWEAAAQAGGRCRSFHDATLDRTIDNGNHLILGANPRCSPTWRRSGQATAWSARSGRPSPSSTCGRASAGPCAPMPARCRGGSWRPRAGCRAAARATT